MRRIYTLILKLKWISTTLNAKEYTYTLNAIEDTYTRSHIKLHYTHTYAHARALLISLPHM